MSAIYFKAAMALVNARPDSEPGYRLTRGGPGYAHRMHWTRRTMILTYISNKLYRRLGQE